MVNWAIVRCARHLAESDAAELVDQARCWGYARFEDLDRDDPVSFKPGPEADLLVKAAVATGAAEQVIQAFVHACFEDPDLIDEVYDGEVALAMRHALAREELRLHRAAAKETHRIRQEARVCAGCGGDFPFAYVEVPFPARFCSRACAPEPPTTPRTVASP